MVGERKRRTSICIKGRARVICGLEIPDWKRPGAKYCSDACVKTRKVEQTKQRRHLEKLKEKYNVS